MDTKGLGMMSQPKIILKLYCHIYRFPWESAYTGAEVTPDLCVACRENQQHITGDIAWAARSLVGKE